MTICFSCIFSKCQDLSSYEGRNLSDAEGRNLYDLVHLTDQDKFLVHTYATQAVTMIEAELRGIIQSTEYVEDEDDLFIFNFLDDRYLYKEIEKQMTETIASYVMQQWLLDKGQARAEAYKLIFASMIAALKRAAVKKRPTLDLDY